jgi:hypothetical protein
MAAVIFVPIDIFSEGNDPLSAAVEDEPDEQEDKTAIPAKIAAIYDIFSRNFRNISLFTSANQR